MSHHVLGVGILSVPERQRRLNSLLRLLELPPDVVALDFMHEGHIINWWRAADIACSKALVGNESPTHALIIEDDAEPCPDFIQTVESLVDMYPDRTISFFTRDAIVKNSTIGTLVNVKDVPTDLAVVYPVKWLKSLKQDYLKQQDSFERRKRRWGYGADEMRAELRPDKVVWATVPSLVEHGCPEASTLSHFYPTNVAARFIGGAESALSIKWEAPKS